MANIGEGEFEFVATITREFFYNNGWGTYKFQTNSLLPNATINYDLGDKSIKGEIYESSLTGTMQQLEVGVEYKVIATNQYHSKYGYNYNPIRIESTVPQTAETQHKFLESIFTTKQANTILEVYPNIVQDVIDCKDDVDCSKLKGITYLKWDELRRKIVDNFVISDILAYLSPHGVSLLMIQKLCDSEKNPALLKQKLETNPYMLTKIPQVGFKKADVIAKKLKPELICSKFRAKAFIEYHISAAGDDDGHTWVQISTLQEEFMNNVPECEEFFSEILSEQKELPTYLHVKQSTVGLLRRYKTERYIWDKLYDINNIPSTKAITDEQMAKGIEISNKFQGFDYDDEQINIIKEATTIGGVQIVTGFAGVGKSTISRGILNVYKQAGYSVITCALSAKASIVITDSTGFPSSTIHRMLGAKGTTFDFNEENPLLVDVVMIDEMSMVNASILSSVLKCLMPTTTLLLVGDGKQLPAIGYGNVFNDIIDINISSLCHIHYLTKFYRQAQDSGIITDANIIRENKYPFANIIPKIVSGKNKDMVYRFFDDKEIIHQTALRVYLKAVESDGLENVIMLCPRKDKCINSTLEFNKEIQDYLLKDISEFFKCNNIEFKVGAKVMQIKNDYNVNVMNGETGYIVKINKYGCDIKFGDMSIPYTMTGNAKNNIGSMGNITLGYAITAHKSQGGSYSTVIGVLDSSHFALLDSTLLYTLITRAKNRCMLISQPYSFKKCITTSNAINRQTYMCNMIERSNEPMQIPCTTQDNDNSKEEKIEKELEEETFDFALDDLPF